MVLVQVHILRKVGKIAGINLKPVLLDWQGGYMRSLVVFLSGLLLASVTLAAEISIAYERYPHPGKLDLAVGTLDFQVEENVLVVRAWFPDPEAQELRTARLAPDSFRDKDTNLLVYIDPVGTGQIAQVFGLSPAGGVQDGLYREGGSTDYGIDFIWTASAQIEARGWRGELRIPLSSLYVPQSGAQAPRVYARYFRSAASTQTYSTHNPADDGGCVLCNAPRLTGLTLAGAQTQALRLKPTLFASRLQERKLGATDNITQTFQAGLDVSYQPSVELQIAATLHPNFSDKEPDSPVLTKNTKFLSFLSETRPFFALGSDVSQTPGFTLINTRQFADPRWGLQSVFRGDNLDGKFVMADSQAGGRLVLPGAYGQDFVTLPATRGLAGRGSLGQVWGNVGAVLTQQHYADVGDTTMVAMDGLRRFDGGYSSTGLLATSVADNCAVQGKLQRCPTRRGNAWYVDLKRQQSLTDWGLSYEQVSPQFRADLGALQQAGYSYVHGWYNTAWPVSQGAINRIDLGIDAYQQTDWQGRLIGTNPSLTGSVSTGFGGVQLKLAPFSEERLSPDSPPIKTPNLEFFVTASPSRQWSKLAVILSAGDLPDYYNGKAGRGVTGLVSSIVTWQRNWDVEGTLRYSSSRAKEAAVLSSAIEGATITERQAQFKLQYALSAFSRLRLVSQLGYANGWNLGDSPLTRFASRSASHSLQLSHAPRSGLSATVGLTTLTRRTDGSQIRSTELFAKTAWAF